MLKKSILMVSIVMAQASLAAPAQFETINKDFNLTCETNNDGKIFSSVLAIKAENHHIGTYLILSSNLFGPYDIYPPLADQKILAYKSEDTFPKTYNYLETKYPENQIIFKKTLKAGFLGREKLQTGISIKFSNSKLTEGSLELTTYWPKKNNVTVCSLTEK